MASHTAGRGVAIRAGDLFLSRCKKIWCPPGIPLLALGGACLHGREGQRAGTGVAAAKLSLPVQMPHHLMIESYPRLHMA
jgi:hypothetical protein